MNAKLSGLALGVSAVALLVAALGTISTIASSPEMDAGVPEMEPSVQRDLVRSAEAIRVRVDDLERTNTELREALASAQTRLENVESIYASTEEQMETVTTEIAKLEKLSVAADRAIFRFGRSQALVRQRLGISDTEMEGEPEEDEEEEPKLEDYLSIVLEPINGLPGPHIILEGVNLHVRSGSGGTGDLGGPLFGLGNFVVGYNEQDPTQFRARTGSHNLIVGSGHGYSSFGGLLAGVANEVNAPNASVSGGTNNHADGWASSISGGEGNLTTGDFSSVAGGIENRAVAKNASVTGGAGNEASGWASSVTGGRKNLARGESSSVTGGSDNKALGVITAILGGSDYSLDEMGYAMVGYIRSEQYLPMPK